MYHTQQEHAGRNLRVQKHEKYIQNSNSREKVLAFTVKNFPNPRLNLTLMQLLLPIGVQTN